MIKQALLYTLSSNPGEISLYIWIYLGSHKSISIEILDNVWYSSFAGTELLRDLSTLVCYFPTLLLAVPCSYSRFFYLLNAMY